MCPMLVTSSLRVVDGEADDPVHHGGADIAHRVETLLCLLADLLAGLLHLLANLRCLGTDRIERGVVRDLLLRRVVPGGRLLLRLVGPLVVVLRLWHAPQLIDRPHGL